MSDSKHVTYEDAGVDTAEGGRAVDAIKQMVKDTNRPEVIGGIGGFGGLFSAAALKDMEDPILISGTDGVGTKLVLAQIMDRHETVGQDLVAMCVNDILASGAEPLFFLDYVAIGHIEAEHMAKIIKGVADGCKLAGCALVGGEMAEHPIVKMSKSLGNVVNPDDVVNEYGADTLRLYEMFIGDFEKAAPWNTSSIKGCKRFLDKIWSMSEKLVPGEGVRPELEAVANRTIKKVGEDIDALKANTAIAQLMIYVNALSDQGGATKAEYELLLQLLNPFAPHMTEELWQQLGHTEQLAYHAWPTYDEAKCVEQTIEIAVQVNGKVKARIKVPAAIENADAIAAAKAEPAVAEAIAGKTIAKEIYVKGKLVNIAVKG